MFSFSDVENIDDLESFAGDGSSSVYEADDERD